MKELFLNLGIQFRELSEKLFENTLRNHEPIPDVYEVQINDHINRTAKSFRFETVQEAMKWVESRELLYQPEKSVYLIRVKPSGENNILQLNVSQKPYVSTFRTTVYTGQAENTVFSS